MGQCFLDYDGLKQFWKVVRDNFVRLNKEDGSITVNAIKIKNYTDSHVLLAGGGLKPLSEFGSGGGSGSGGTISSLSNSLTIQANGETIGTPFNGSSPVTVNITTNKLINGLSTATATPQDGDYFISQFVGGGTKTTTYHRRPMSALWAYIKGKTDAQYATSGHTHSNYLPLTGGTLTGNLTTNGTLTATTIKKSGSNSTNDFVLLAGGGTKPLSEFGSGSGSVSGNYLPLTGGTMNNGATITGKNLTISNSPSENDWGDLYLGNAYNNGMIAVQTDMYGLDKSITGKNTWNIYTNGGAEFESLVIGGKGIGNGTITASKFKVNGGTNNQVLLADGTTKALSEITSGSGSTSTINATLWGNSFNGSGSVNGDISFLSPGLQDINSHGIRLNRAGTGPGNVAFSAKGFIGFSEIMGETQPGGTIVGGFSGISLGWGTKPETDSASVRINGVTFTYKGNTILHTGNIGDYYTSIPVVTATTNGLMSSDMFKAPMVKSVGIKQGEAMIRPGDGSITITDHSVYITQNKENITGVYQTAIEANYVKIPNATKDYDGSMSYTDKRKLDNMIAILNQNIQISDLFGGTAQKSPSIPDFDHTNPPSLLRINFTDTAFVCTLCSTDYVKTAIYHNAHNNYTVTVKNTAVTITK